MRRAQVATPAYLPRSRRQRTRPAAFGELPGGVMVRHGGTVGLVLGDGMLPWSFTGYQPAVAIAPAAAVELLTPPAAVAAIAAGYRPLVHPSAAAVPSGRVRRLPAAADAPRLGTIDGADRG